MRARACVIGSGPNGLAAAIVLAQAGLQVDTFEAESIPGGAARTMELTLPGFLHDFGSAVHPLGVGSPFFASLPLKDHGLEWIHPPAVLAHALDDGSAVTLERDLRDAESALGPDGKAWRDLLQPLSDHWWDFAADVLSPILHLPHHPWLLARFGSNALRSAKSLADAKFKNDRTKALFAGIAAHSFMPLDNPLSASFTLVLAAAAHAVGWPIPRRGSQSLTNALLAHLTALGANLKTSAHVESLAALPGYDLYLCDVTPRQLLQIAGKDLSQSYQQRMADFRYGPGVFKVDYALSAPVPWRAPDFLRAATVHLGGSFDEIAAGEAAVCRGTAPERPFVLLSQPSLFDPTRAPDGKHIVWAYCHVPNGSKLDMLPRIEAQIERFAPGFRDCVLARRAFAPANLEAMDANLIGGNILGGDVSIRQLLFRPSWRQYATSNRKIYLCSASTPPGGGVHGMCGYNAAKLALTRMSGQQQTSAPGSASKRGTK